MSNHQQKKDQIVPPSPTTSSSSTSSSSSSSPKFPLDHVEGSDHEGKTPSEQLMKFLLDRKDNPVISGSPRSSKKDDPDSTN